MDEPQRAMLLDELRQLRVMLTVAILMIGVSIVVDAPVTTIGIVLEGFALVLLLFAVLRIHRSHVRLKSSPPNP